MIYEKFKTMDVHRIEAEATADNEYLEGTIVKMIGHEVYNDVDDKECSYDNTQERRELEQAAKLLLG